MFPTVPSNSGDLKEKLKKTENTGNLGTNYLKFSGKSDEWSYGQSKEDVYDGEIFVNAYTFAHGWILWTEGSPVKAFSSRFEALPMKPESVEYKGETKHAEEARAFQARFTDSQEIVTFSTSSISGVNAVESLISEVSQRSLSDSDYVFPRVKLTSYPFGKHGNFAPKFEVMGWVNAEGDEEVVTQKLEQKEPAVEEEKAEQPKRRKRRA